VAQGVEGRDSGAQQRRRIARLELRGNQRQRFERRDHVVGIAAVITDAGNLATYAGNEIAAAAGAAVAAMPAMPTHADALARLPVGHADANGVDQPDHFVARHAWISDARKCAQLCE
jgi:hypothetical protein